MADGRKNNGGNSTKAKGIDKRKNQYKDVLEKAVTPEHLIEVIKMLYKKSTQDEDVGASKILLEYYLGKPTQEVINTNLNINEEELTKDVIDKIKERIENYY